MKKVFSFGKIDYNGTGRKINPVEVEVCLTIKDGKPCFTASGYIYNQTKTNVYCCGQCLDEIAKSVHDPIFNEIYRLWKLYHLNDMHAGTVEQEKAIDDWKAQGNQYDYKKVCDYLKSIGLYEVEHHGKPYQYGHDWLYWEIPKEDFKIIERLFD